MALVTADRVREFTSTNGTGTLTLTGAAVGYQTFSSAIGNGNTCYYAVYNPGINEWEVGIGTVGAGTLARTTVLSSSNGDALVPFSAGTKDVFVTYPAEAAVFSGGTPSFTSVTAGSVSSGQVDITAQGDLRLQDTSGGQYVALQAPGTVPASYTLTMPDTDGDAGQALITDGSGNLSWSTAASGDVYGPASATDNAVARFDGTTGKLIKNSTMTIASDGAAVLSVNSSSDALRITQVGSGNALVVEDSANPDSTPFVIDSSGRELVGYTASLTGGGGQVANVQIVGGGVNTASLHQFTYSTTGSDSPYHFFNKSASATLGTQSIVASGDQLGGISFAGSDGTAFRTAANIVAQVDGTPGTNDMPGRLVFSTTADGASSPTERMRITSAGNIGVGTTPAAYTSLYVSKVMTGGVNTYGVLSDGQVQSDSTSSATYFWTGVRQAAGFTLSTLNHYSATQGTLSGTVTNQYGFSVGSSLTGATNNYGFYSNIASGTGRYNFYASGSADNYFAGNVGIGQLGANVNLNIQKSVTGNANLPNIYSVPSYQSDVTGAAVGFWNNPFTAAASFTVSTLQGFRADGVTLGSGSAVTNQEGFAAGSGITAATNNYGFRSNIASGTGRYNFYAAGTAANYMAGRLGIGDTTDVGASVFVNLGLTSSIAYGIRQQNYFASGVTSAVQNSSQLYVGPSATINVFKHFQADQAALGSGATITSQYGYITESSLTSATNNYGFYSNIASGTGRYNFYAGGSATNYFAGVVQCGTELSVSTGSAQAAVGISCTNNTVAGPSRLYIKSSSSGTNYAISGSALGEILITSYAAYSGGANIAAYASENHSATNLGGYLSFRTTPDGATSATERMRIDSSGRVGIGVSPEVNSVLTVGSSMPSGQTAGSAQIVETTIGSSYTGRVNYYRSYLNTAAASFTVANASHYYASQGGLGAGSAVTNQHGFFAESDLTGATNNYGFYSNIASGTGRYNFYSAGSADNYFAGLMLLGGPTAAQYNHYSSGFALQLSKSNSDLVQLASFQNNVNGGDIVLTKSRGATVGTNTVVQSGDFLGNILFIGADGTNYVRAAAIQAVVDGTPGTNDMPGRLMFSTTADGASSPTERMRIRSDGNIGIGSVGATARALLLTTAVSGATTGYGIQSSPVFQSGVTSGGWAFYAGVSTQAAAFTLSTGACYVADNGVVGAGSTLTNQYGFWATSALTTATNNYGFYSSLAAGTGRWNFYAAGTADNYFAGAVGIGTTSLAGANVYSNRNLTGSTTAYSIITAGPVQSDVTVEARSFSSYLQTSGAAWTLPNAIHYHTQQGSFGSTTVTNQHGFYAKNDLTGATNNYGFYSNIAYGTGRWNFYAAGSADNYFAGNVGINETSFTSKFHVTTPSQGGIATFKNTNASWAADVSVSYSPSGTETSAIAFSARSDGSAWITTNYGATVFRTGTGGSASERMRIDSSGNLISTAPTTAPTLSTNGTMVFNLTSNTNLRVSVRGSDGVTRTANITLA